MFSPDLGLVLVPALIQMRVTKAEEKLQVVRVRKRHNAFVADSHFNDEEFVAQKL